LNNDCFVLKFIDVTVVFDPVKMVGSADSGRVVVIFAVVVAELVPVLFDGDVCLMICRRTYFPLAYLVPKFLYVITNPNQLLSPQHLAQMLQKKEMVGNGTRRTTYADTMGIEWNDLKHKETVPLD
jgi:hypothetical protein